MPPVPVVPCRPFFKLRRLTPHIQIGPEAPSPWNVPSLCAAYKWPTGLAGGGVIAIVELGGGWVQSDINQYFKSINQPLPLITDVSVDGTKNSPNQSTGSGSDPDVEVALDIEVAAAAYFVATARPATIRIYWSQDIASAVQKAAKDGCDVCSISWGADEAMWGATAVQQMESTAASATSGGMIVFAASGDNDSSTADQLLPTSTLPPPAPMSWVVAAPTRPPPSRPSGTTALARPTAKARVAATPLSFRCRVFKSAFPSRRPARHLEKAAWSPTSPGMPTPTRGTTLSFTGP